MKKKFLFLFFAPLSLWGGVQSKKIAFKHERNRVINNVSSDRFHCQIKIKDQKNNIELSTNIYGMPYAQAFSFSFFAKQIDVTKAVDLKRIDAKVTIYKRLDNGTRPSIFFKEKYTIAENIKEKSLFKSLDKRLENQDTTLLQQFYTAQIELICIPNNLWDTMKAKPKLSISLSVLFTVLTALGIGGSYKLYKKKKKEKLAAKKKEEKREKEEETLNVSIGGKKSPRPK